MDDNLAGRLHDANLEELGRRIRNARLTANFTQAQLAAGEVSVAYVSRIEAGQRRPDLVLLSAFASRLGTPVEALVPEVPGSEVAYQYSLRMAEFALESGDADTALALTGELFERPRSRVAADLELEARYLRARALEAGNDYEAAIDELEVIAQATGSSRWLVSLIALSRCCRESGDFGRAIEVGDRMRDRLKELGLESSDEAIQLELTVGYAYFARGDVAHAVRLVRQSIQRAEEMGSPVARASAYWNASIYESRQGATPAAVGLAGRALALLGEGSDARNLARLRAELGAMLLQLDPPDLVGAEEQLQRASSALRASSASLTDSARCELELARVRFSQGDFDAAAEVAEGVRDTAQGSAPELEAAALTLLGQTANANGDTAAAAQLYRSAVAVLTSVGADRAAAQSWLDLGALLDDVGEADAARSAYRSAAIATGLKIPQTLLTRVR